jgi:phosphoribosylformylglycinamidine synthase subunit PurQ / glutaminase
MNHSTVKALVLRAPGINRDGDAATALLYVGAAPTLAHINAVADGSIDLDAFGLVVVPGGFSYGDHLGAGRLLAIDLQHRLGEKLRRFVASGRPLLGICNGFQVLVKADILPGDAAKRQEEHTTQRATLTLTDNASRRFECRWVQLTAEPQSVCVFTRGIERPLEVPVAHGEGRVAVADQAVLEQLRANGQIALRYSGPNGGTADYPYNPNGSAGAIAGICNQQGNVLGLMPHPENAIFAQQHPRWTREPWRTEGDGATIFRNAVAYARS